MNKLRILIILAAAVLAQFAGAQVADTLAPIRLKVAMPQQSFYRTVPPGNYSGITHIGGNAYAVVSDKAEKSGFFVFYIDMDENTGMINNVTVDEQVKSPLDCRDEEGIAYRSDTRTLFIAGEADTRVLEYTLQGELTGRELQVPAVFGKARKNLGLESLAYNAATHRFWTTTESSLPCDGQQSSWRNQAQNRLRLQSFGDDLQPMEQYAYLMDAPVARDTALYDVIGVSDLLALDDGRLLVLERECHIAQTLLGSYVNQKIYVVNPQAEQAVAADKPLTADAPFVQKQLLYEWHTMLSLLGYDLANYEGMCLGPTLRDGSRTIILISDSQARYEGVLQDWLKVLIIN